ncbi:MAG TPA: YCF48-related protein [Candidatus Limnocylindrales bacterium]|nr:YCF48-related protein [Candidatus Limnocylindrales bacterium]
MNRIDLSGRRWALAFAALASLSVAACHGNEDWEPMATQKIYVADRFYDLVMLGPKEAIVIGYDGKLLSTADMGASWNVIDSGTEAALYSIDMAPDKKTGWIVGQESTILRTTDGGKSWQRQDAKMYMNDECREQGGDPEATEESNKCPLAPLFALSVIDENNAIAVGDRSTVARTTDGGKTWTATTLKPTLTEELDENAMIAFEDPVLYDVQFVDGQTGFVVGEFGKIMKTTDGGKSWTEKQSSLVGEEYIDIMDLPTFFDVEVRGNTAYVAGLDGRVATSNDGGESWTWVAHNIKEYDAPFYSVALVPDGSVWAVGASGQAVYAPPGGPLGKGNLGTQVNNWIREVKFYDEKVGWMVGGFGFIMNTNDGGKTWFRRIG